MYTSYFKEVRKISGHECMLPLEPDPTQVYITDGYWVPLRRYLMKMRLVSEHNLQAKLVLKSTRRIQLEKLRQIRGYPLIIHPFSMARYSEQVVMAIVYLLILLISPLDSFSNLYLFYKDMVQPDQKVAFNALVHGLFGILSIFCLLDIIFLCFCGYYDNKEERIYLSFKTSFKHYLKTYFFVDVIASIPLGAIILGLNLPMDAVFCDLLIHYVRIGRIGTCLFNIDKLNEIFKIASYKLGLIKKILVLAIITLWGSVFYYQLRAMHLKIKNTFNTNLVMHEAVFNTSEFIKVVYLVSTTEDTTIMELVVLQIILLHAGNIFLIAVIAVFWSIHKRSNLSERNFEKLLLQIKAFAKFKELQDSLRNMLVDFVEFKFKKRIYDEEKIVKTMTPHLRDEILLEVCRKLVQNVQIFQSMPTSAMTRIASRLKSEIFLPNDIIMQAGYEGSNMYFILDGTVAVYTSQGIEVCHLTNGANFGEIALLMKVTRTASVMATDFCDLFKLSRKDFQEAIEPYPELKKEMYKIAKERFDSLLQKDEAQDIDRLSVNSSEG